MIPNLEFMHGEQFSPRMNELLAMNLCITINQLCLRASQLVDVGATFPLSIKPAYNDPRVLVG